MNLIDREKTLEEIPIDVCDGFEVTDIIEKMPIVQAIPIPEHATNGDMIKAMFPICCSNMGNPDNGIVVDFMGDLHTFNKDWWNAPYKKEVEK